MGSFASSLHVRSDDWGAVAAAVKAALRGEGFESTDEPLDADARWGMSASLRGIHISTPREGWVAILENDPLSSVSLAADVSRRLDTYAIQFFVNDSDSWHYQLFRGGRQIDAFDSSADQESEWDEDALDERGEFPAGGLAGIEQAILGKAQEFEKLLTAGMPPNVREIHEKVQAGQATQSEMQQYMQWVSAEMPKHMTEMQRLVGEAMQGMGLNGGSEREADAVRRGSSRQAGHSLEQEEQALLPHVENLRPLLAAGTPSDLVLELLGRQAVFAEETLGEFLPLVGIAPVYAHLSYRYLEEFSESELASQSVRMAEHLRFRSGFDEEEE